MRKNLLWAKTLICRGGSFQKLVLIILTQVSKLLLILPVDASKEICTLSFIYTRVYILTLLGLAQAFSRGRERGCSLVWGCGLLTAVASPVVGRGLQARGLSSLGSRTLACWHSSLGDGLGCSSACGILLDRGSNL